MNADTSNISTFSQWHPILTDLLNVNSLAVKSQRYLQLDNPLSICSLGLPGPTATQVLLFPHFISHCTASLMVFIITCRPIDSCCEIRDFILSWRPSAVPLPAEDVPISQLKVSPTCHGDPPTWGYTVVVFFFKEKMTEWCKERIQPLTFTSTVNERHWNQTSRASLFWADEDLRWAWSKIKKRCFTTALAQATALILKETQWISQSSSWVKARATQPGMIHGTRAHLKIIPPSMYPCSGATVHHQQTGF